MRSQCKNSSLAEEDTMVSSPSYDICRNHCHPFVFCSNHWGLVSIYHTEKLGLPIWLSIGSPEEYPGRSICFLDFPCLSNWRPCLASRNCPLGRRPTGHRDPPILSTLFPTFSHRMALKGNNRCQFRGQPTPTAFVQAYSLVVSYSHPLMVTFCHWRHPHVYCVVYS